MDPIRENNEMNAANLEILTVSYCKYIQEREGKASPAANMDYRERPAYVASCFVATCLAQSKVIIFLPG